MRGRGREVQARDERKRRRGAEAKEEVEARDEWKQGMIGSEG